jgi:sortase A
MEIGDTFYFTILDRTITYEVDQIRIVEPDDTSLIQIEDGKDYCTLLTCTPYGINTHRLIVRGVRVPFTPSEPEEQGPYTIVSIIGLQDVGWGVVGAVIGGVVLVIVILFVIIIKTGKKDKKSNRNKNNNKTSGTKGKTTSDERYSP